MGQQTLVKKGKSIEKVVHVLDVFPTKSETFVVNFIIETLNHGYSAQILTNVKRSIKTSSQQDLLVESGLYVNSETFNPTVPEHKLKRLVFAIGLLLRNLRFSFVFIRTLNVKRYGLKSKTLKMWFQAGVFLKYRDTQIFHAHFGNSGKVLAEMKEIGAVKGKIITSFYGYDTFSITATENHFKNYYLGTFKYSEYIVTSSNYLFKNLIRLNIPKEKVLVNSVGVNTELFNYKERDFNGIFSIITVGRLIQLKGQHIGIDVIKILKERGCKIHYTIVGIGNEYEALKQKIERLCLNDVVTLIGARSQVEIIKLLQEHHLFLMTSITDDSGRAEGQGLVIAEAQATGIPIVGFNSGGVSEAVLNEVSGFVIDEGNALEMADAVEKFILSPNLINAYGMKARAFVEQNFNNKIQTQNIIDLYKK